MAEKVIRSGVGVAAQIRRDYEGRVGVVPARKVARDLATVLEDRRELQRAAEVLADAAAPYSADPRIAAALDELRKRLEARG